jgi:hypothetical protein
MRINRRNKDVKNTLGRFQMNLADAGRAVPEVKIEITRVVGAVWVRAERCPHLTTRRVRPFPPALRTPPEKADDCQTAYKTQFRKD